MEWRINDDDDDDDDDDIKQINKEVCTSKELNIKIATKQF
jgi:hypothetical protein